MKTCSYVSICNLRFKSIFVTCNDKLYIFFSVSFQTERCCNVARISASICFSLVFFLAMPCKTASEEINNKLQYSKTHIYIFHSRLLEDVSVTLEIKFLNFNESIRILLERKVSCKF